MSKEKRPRGRPVEYEMPPPIPATPEELLKAVVTTRPPKAWEYLEQKKTKEDE